MPEDLDLKKLYIGQYPLEGRTKPAARDDFIQQFNEGALILTYIGHGNPATLAHEQMFVLTRDIDGINKPLVLEDLNPNGIFENAETWKFVIDGYFNSLGIPPSALESVGLVGNFSVSTASDNGRSSGSIIGTPVPEPTTGMLMGLGLAGISMAGRRRLRS